jgi:glycosyltransferase involved in cell wall biosynthesis
VPESILCGTPVIAYTRGSRPDPLIDKKTGFLVDSVEGAVEAITNIEDINRKDCRDWAASSFSKEKMVEGYLEVYRKLTN